VKGFYAVSDRISTCIGDLSSLQVSTPAPRHPNPWSLGGTILQLWLGNRLRLTVRFRPEIGISAQENHKFQQNLPTKIRNFQIFELITTVVTNGIRELVI
jgi:hypothetical protein